MHNVTSWWGRLSLLSLAPERTPLQGGNSTDKVKQLLQKVIP